MIAKHIPMNSVKKSDFAGLASYISDSQHKNERVDSVTITNCHASFMVASSDVDRLRHAIIEVTNTQKKNTRAESDKTYHLLVSFRAGERPADQTLHAIEARLCEGLGYADHQRVSAVHTDTDNLHIHIAINKIHPARYTLHDPYYGHKTLAKCCESLEQKYGLEIDNHRPFKAGSENKASDMEHHAGIESLMGWIKRECADQIKAASSWAELHQVLGGYGLELRERGNGFVFVDHNGLMVKASSVARELSKVKLEDKLGAFNASISKSKRQYTNPAKQYEVKPLKSRIDTTLLFNQFKKEQQESLDLRAKEWKVTRDRKDRLTEVIKQAGHLKRSSIKLLVSSRLEKKLLYSLTSKATYAEIQSIKDNYNRERQAVFKKHRPQQWADWLRSKAIEGNADALAALRAREAAEGLKGNTVTAGGPRSMSQARAVQDGVTKKGTIIYSAGSSAIRDDGDQLKIARGTGRDGLEAALRLAMERYGNHITVNGSAVFKAHIIKVAADTHLALTFTDSALERQRLALMPTSSTATQERQYELSTRRERTGSGISGAGSQGRNANAGRNERTGAVRHRSGNQSNFESITSNPPPEARNRLRNLSMLGLVRFATGSEVLLPSHVSRHMEQHGTQPNNPLRRNTARAVTLHSLSAADQYINEREHKRLKQFDILIHRRYNDSDAGASAFAGVRRIDGQSLALLKRDNEILVMPVDEKTANRLSRLSMGSIVTCAGMGLIKRAGKSR